MRQSYPTLQCIFSIPGLIATYFPKSLLRHYRYPQKAISMSSAPSDPPRVPNYPIAKDQHAATLTRQNVLDMLLAGQKPGVDFVLVDLRRGDYIVGSLSYS